MWRRSMTEMWSQVTVIPCTAAKCWTGFSLLPKQPFLFQCWIQRLDRPAGKGQGLHHWWIWEDNPVAVSSELNCMACGCAGLFQGCSSASPGFQKELGCRRSAKAFSSSKAAVLLILCGGQLWQSKCVSCSNFLWGISEVKSRLPGWLSEICSCLDFALGFSQCPSHQYRKGAKGSKKSQATRLL